jgi:lysylphosphatidylglycerol synthetase-like protein (DUF2156 family)
MKRNVVGLKRQYEFNVTFYIGNEEAVSSMMTTVKKSVPAWVRQDVQEEASFVKGIYAQALRQLLASGIAFDDSQIYDVQIDAHEV